MASDNGIFVKTWLGITGGLAASGIVASIGGYIALGKQDVRFEGQLKDARTAITGRFDLIEARLAALQADSDRDDAQDATIANSVTAYHRST